MIDNEYIINNPNFSTVDELVEYLEAQGHSETIFF